MYSGSPPASPNAAVTGTYLGRVTKAGGHWDAGTATNGINLATPTLNVITKEPAEEWKFVCEVPGTIGWGRFVGNPVDAGGASDTLHRMDFDVSLTGGGASCTMTLITFTTVGQTGVVQTFNLPLTNRT